MRISLNWLQELVELTLEPRRVSRNTDTGWVRGRDIEDRHTGLMVLSLGVLECQPHPNADKLSVTRVDIGAAEPLNIVVLLTSDICMPVTVGTYPPRSKIRAAKLRGVRSEGMICSLAEVGLAKESAGIHIFEQENIPLVQTPSWV